VHPASHIEFRAGSPEFSYLLNIFLLEGEPAQKILKEKYSGTQLGSRNWHPINRIDFRAGEGMFLVY
jgi:hypothetical protein